MHTGALVNRSVTYEFARVLNFLRNIRAYRPPCTVLPPSTAQSAREAEKEKRESEMSEESEAMSFESDGLYVKESDRRSWWSIAMIWIGNGLNVSTLMTGAALGAGLTLFDSVAAAFIGFGIVVAYMCFVAMESVDVGLPTAAMSTAALGKKGGRYVVGFIVGVSCLGWFGVQAAVCGASFSIAFAELTGMVIPVWLCSTVLGLLMLLSAIYGFNGVKWVNYVAAPLLFVICLYGLAVSVSGTGVDSVFNYVPVEGMGLVAGISISVGLFAVGGATVGDFTRYARDRKGAVLSSIIGVWPVNVFMLAVGATLAIVVPDSAGDITIILSSMGLALISMIAIVASTWALNAGNAYTSGLAFTVMAGKGQDGYKVATAIAGVLGIVLADIGIMDYFTTFLTFLSAMVPALAGSMIADYFFVRKGRAENFKPLDGVSVPGVVSFVVGAVLAMITGGTFAGTPLEFLDFPLFIGPINGIVVSMVLYVVIYKAMKLPSFDGPIVMFPKKNGAAK